MMHPALLAVLDEGQEEEPAPALAIVAAGAADAAPAAVAMATNAAGSKRRRPGPEPQPSRQATRRTVLQRARRSRREADQAQQDCYVTGDIHHPPHPTAISGGKQVYEYVVTS